MSSLEFRLKKIDETRNLFEEFKHNDLISEKYKKTCNYLNYVEHLLILVSTVTANSIVQHPIQIKNGIIKHVNMNAKVIIHTTKIIVGILAHVFVRMVSIYKVLLILQ